MAALRRRRRLVIRRLDLLALATTFTLIARRHLALVVALLTSRTRLGLILQPLAGCCQLGLQLLPPGQPLR